MRSCDFSRARNATLVGFTTLNPCDHFSRIGTSVSRWCSKGDNQCPLMQEQPCGCEQCFAHLMQDTELCIEAGAAIPFTGRAILKGDCFLPFGGGMCACSCCCCGEAASEETFVRDGYIMLDGPGIYRVEYTINIPSTAGVDTEVHLVANDMIIPGTSRTISHIAGDPAISIHMDSVFEIDGPACVGLISTNVLCFTPTVEGETSASMSITSIA